MFLRKKALVTVLAILCGLSCIVGISAPVHAASQKGLGKAQPNISCPTLTRTSSQATITGDVGHNPGVNMGVIQVSMTVTRSPNDLGGCAADSISTIVYVQLYNGTWVETNGPNCAGSSHSCGASSDLAFTNTSGNDVGEANNFYGIWGAPWGPRWVYGSSENDPGNPAGINNGITSYCVTATGVYQDNFGKPTFSPSTSGVCYNNA